MQVPPSPNLVHELHHSCDLVYDRAQMTAVEVCSAIPAGMTPAAVAQLISGELLPSFTVRYRSAPQLTPPHRVIVVISLERADELELLTPAPVSEQDRIEWCQQPHGRPRAGVS